MKTSLIAMLTLAGCSAAPPPPPSQADADLEVTLTRRLHGDRTGACLAAAVVGEQVARARVCADPATGARIDLQTSLEIGSITKTMDAFLLADLVGEGKLALTDPVADRLPPGAKVPAFGNEPIRLEHLVTHTAGLPPLPARLTIADPANPYVTLTEGELLDSLGDLPPLARPPGSSWAYSNFGGMVLSYVLATTAGQDIEAMLAARLFAPLGMKQAYVAHPPAGTRVAVGHLSTGGATSPWDLPPRLAGVGGVRASLEDMIRYLQAELGQGDRHVVDVMARTRAPQDGIAAPNEGLGWVSLPLAGRKVLVHDGGTGGFSSLMVLDLERGRASVVLSDTSMVNLGNLVDIGLHLVEPSFPLETPRTVATPPAALLDRLAGTYDIPGIGGVVLLARDGALVVRLAGEEAAMGYDSHGDFFPLGDEGLLTPKEEPGGGLTFVWIIQGIPFPATRAPRATLGPR